MSKDIGEMTKDELLAELKAMRVTPSNMCRVRQILDRLDEMEVAA
jgi:hypothetical protein